MKTAAAPMPRAQRYKVERRAGASLAAASARELLDELWAPLLAALSPAAELDCVSSACVVICIAERAARHIIAGHCRDYTGDLQAAKDPR